MEDIAVSVWQTTLDGMPLKVTEWVNNRGDVVQMVIDSGAGKIEGASPSPFVCQIPNFVFEAENVTTRTTMCVCARARAFRCLMRWLISFLFPV